MSRSNNIYKLLSTYVRSNDPMIKENIAIELNKLKEKNYDQHKLLEHDEYFFNKYVDELKDDFGGFILSNNQKFLKQFMSLNTSNRTLLLFHGVGVGKTCSSIHIAKNFNNLRSNMQKTILVTSKLLVSNYMRELFDKSKITEIDNTCLGGEYITRITNYTKLTKKELHKEVKSLIKQDYVFYGYLEFSNEVFRNKQNYETYINTTFSNRLIIIDEVHNIRLNKNNEIKKLPFIIQDIYKFAVNVRILFLSATPMYNEAEEIIWIMDALMPSSSGDTLLQSKKAKVIEDIFDDNNNLVPQFEKKLLKFAKNHVSYMRGENPLTFPIRLNPSVNNDTNILKLSDYPTVDVYNEPIDQNINKAVFGGIELVASYFSDIQLIAYKKLPYKTAVVKETESENEYESNDLQKRIQLANVYYPNPNVIVGESGLKTIFNIKIESKNIKFDLKDEKENIFNKENIGRYSPKIKTIIDYVNQSEGIVIIYSKYIFSGIIPIGLALESHGYNRYKQDNISSIPSNAQTKVNRGNYIILSGLDSLSPNKDEYINISKQEENKNGDQIKVILISQVATEGVDFKNVREIHVLEPWYNMSQIEQITGRGVRNNSHIHLPEEKRNTTIYLHVNMIPDEKTESVDFRMYRTSMKKQFQISKVERVIKSGSVDCNLNINVNHYPINFMKKTLQTSQGNILKDYAIGDKMNSRICDYTDCDYKCVPMIDKKPKINNTELMDYDIQLYVNQIIKLFEKLELIFMTYETLQMHFKNKSILDHALIILTNSSIYKLKKEPGRFIYKSNKYIFVPKYLEDDKVALSYQDYIKTVSTRKVLIKDTPIKLTTESSPKTMSSSTLSIIDDIHKESDTLYAIIHKYTYLEKDMSVLFAMVFDNMNKTNQLTTILELIKLEKIPEQIKEMLERSGLCVFEKDSLVSYWDIYGDQLYVKKTTIFEKASPIEKENNVSKFNLEIKNIISSNNMILGYIDISKKTNTSVFKMANKDSLKNNKRKSVIGTICKQTSQISNSIMKDYLSDLGVKLKITPKKSLLCIIYEYSVRINKSDSFLRPRYFQQYNMLIKN